MMAKEWLARGIIIFGVVMVIFIPAIHHWRPTPGVVLHASMAETGGWMPTSLTAVVGEPTHLRLTSDDVMHGFAVGQLDQPAVDINPGEIADITLVFTKPGKYTYYCTRWCSVNHWRMRGTIDVSDSHSGPEPAKQPLYVTLGLNIDTDHQARLTPNTIPSPWRGALLKQNIPIAFSSREYYLSHSPIDLWMSLRSDLTTSGLTDQDIWDLVAWIWQSNSTPQGIQAGKQLYVANCAACHGETGAGDGVFANQLANSSMESDIGHDMGAQTQRPANFADAIRMLSASPAHLQGKIIRGGMGTGMPSWGAIFTDDQTWALVAYLWSFQFQLEVNP
jgi:mono/diheme cytochrome c family protein/plastocyanin